MLPARPQRKLNGVLGLGEGRGHAPRLIVDRDGRYLVANGAALLDLAVEIIGCLHDRDRLKRPHTERLTLTDLDAGVTALDQAIAHLRDEPQPRPMDGPRARGHAWLHQTVTEPAPEPHPRHTPHLLGAVAFLLPLLGAAVRVVTPSGGHGCSDST